MYKQIDELIEVISNDSIFLDYKESEKNLYNQEIKDLLLKHQILQEEYMKVRKYAQYTSLDETKQELLDIKEKMKNNLIIQDYYNNYYRLNELLEDVTNIIFKNISQDINVEMFKL